MPGMTALKNSAALVIRILVVKLHILIGSVMWAVKRHTLVIKRLRTKRNLAMFLPGREQDWLTNTDAEFCVGNQKIEILGHPLFFYQAL